LTVTADNGKHKITFNLRGVPLVNQFVQRYAETQKLEQLLISTSSKTRRRQIVVLHGLGGIGKTQLAAEFVREQHHNFSAVFWLDGSSEASLKQSFAEILQWLPQDELTVDGVEMLRHSAPDVDVAVRECVRWLSLPSNQHWLLVFDNVDRDFHGKHDPQAYNIKDYLPYADHGSILITSRLASLQRHGSELKVGVVNAEQATAILENNAGKKIMSRSTVLLGMAGIKWLICYRC
jgi:hypothetical protein